MPVLARHAMSRLNHRARMPARRAAVLVASVVFTVCGQAQADVSSWLYTGAGASWVGEEEAALDGQLTLQIDAGMGTDPSHSLIFGGLARIQPHFTRGTDLAVLARAATHGFVNGGFGGAIDVGPYQRFWGAGSTGVLGTLTVGAPWGLTLSAGGGLGTNGGRSFSFTFGIDLARLTVYRRSGTSWFPNPLPAYRPESDRPLEY